MARVNLNQYVKVRLSDRGRQILKDSAIFKAGLDADGFLHIQLWDLMRIFGPHYCDGAVLPFESTWIELGDLL